MEARWVWLLGRSNNCWGIFWPDYFLEFQGVCRRLYWYENEPRHDRIVKLARLCLRPGCSELFRLPNRLYRAHRLSGASDLHRARGVLCAGLLRPYDNARRAVLRTPALLR